VVEYVNTTPVSDPRAKNASYGGQTDGHELFVKNLIGRAEVIIISHTHNYHATDLKGKGKD